MSKSFDPSKFISDKPITEGEREILGQALDKTKVRLFYENEAGFIAPLIATMEFRWDRTIPTACTNGVFMAWNPEFFLSLDNQSRVTVLAHEGWHVAFQHMLRINGRDMEAFNSAADYVINNMLKKNGYYMDGFPYLLDPQYEGMTTEQVYDKLPKDGGKPNPQHGDFVAPGSGPDSINQGMSPTEIEKKAQGNLIDAATIAKMGDSFGDLPGEVQKMIDEFLNPKLDWRVILMNFFESLTSTEFSYRRPNRRYQDPLLPGRTGRNGLEHLIYFLDISGSVTDAEIVRFNSEVKHIKETYNPERLTLVTFDTKIHDIYEFEEDDDFEKIIVTGRGGTNLKEVYQYMKDHPPNAAVIFTDLRVKIPPEAPACPLIWICSGNPKATVPYGTLIHIEEEE